MRPVQLPGMQVAARLAAVLNWHPQQGAAARAPKAEARLRRAICLRFLALRVLRGFPRALEAVLLALLHPRIPGREARLAEREPVPFGIELQQRPADTVPDRACLARNAAPAELGHRGEADFRPRAG